MMCPASCFPMLRGLPPWPCLLSWAQHGDGDTGTWPAATTSSTGVNQDTPPICPDKHTPPPPSRIKCAQLDYIRSQHQRTDLVSTNQREASRLQAACTCPYSSSCRWQGILGDVVSHLVQAHHQQITQREGEEVVFHFSTNTDTTAAAAGDTTDWIMLQSCFGRTFVLVVKKAPVVRGGRAAFSATVLFIGLSEEAEGFVYRLELRGNRQRLMWEATPRAIQDSLAVSTTTSLVSSSDCMTFDPSVADLFAQDSGTLGLHVSISRACCSTTGTDPSRHSHKRPTHRQLMGRVHPTSRTLQGHPNMDVALSPEAVPSIQL